MHDVLVEAGVPSYVFRFVSITPRVFLSILQPFGCHLIRVVVISVAMMAFMITPVLLPYFISKVMGWPENPVKEIVADENGSEGVGSMPTSEPAIEQEKSGDASKKTRKTKKIE